MSQTVTLDAGALANIDALADAASRGPWECREGDGLAAILTPDGWLEDCSAEQEVANARFMAAANPAVVRALVAIAQRAAKLEAANKPWTRVEDAIPERLPEGRQFSREVLVVDRTRNTPPRLARVHYYPNHPPVWDGGDPTHWRDVPDLPDDDEPLGKDATAATPSAPVAPGGAGNQVDASEKAGLSVVMPRNISEASLAVAAAAVRAGLNELTGSDGHVVRKTFQALHAHLAERHHEGPALGTAEHVLLPADLDDDLWRAGIEAFRKALNLRTGVDMFTARQTYEGLYAHLAKRKEPHK